VALLKLELVDARVGVGTSLNNTEKKQMGKGRLEAFSDGVIAIIITIMVLELKVPHGALFNDLLPLLPVLGSYVLSFIYIGIYWNKHRHTNNPQKLEYFVSMASRNLSVSRG
jgi:hypothetical protein